MRGKAMTLRAKLDLVVENFKRLPSSDIASESKLNLIQAAKELEELLATPDISEVELKKTSDLIIAGAIILAMAISDRKYNAPDFYFGDQYMYTRKPTEVFKGLKTGMTFREQILHLGDRALISKDLPFTGIFDKTFYNGVFSSLSKVLKKEHFSEYGLNTDPATMDPTEINRPGKEARAKAKADNKWNKPFGLGQVLGYDLIEFSQRKESIQSKLSEQDQRYSAARWKWCAYVILACIVAPLTLFISLFFTIPWLRKKHAEIKTEYENRTWVKTEFTVEEFDQVRAQREALKSTFTDKPPTNKDKPHKVCVGLDADGNVTRKKENMSKIVMLSDKAQAKRWSPSFLKEATPANYKESVEESVSYKSAQ